MVQGVPPPTVTLKLSECVVPCCVALRVQFVAPAFIGVRLKLPIVANRLFIEKKEGELQTSEYAEEGEVHPEL